jgi:hypothetical protein
MINRVQNWMLNNLFTIFIYKEINKIYFVIIQHLGY